MEQQKFYTSIEYAIF